MMERDFEKDRKRFLAEFFGERADCSGVDLVIAVQNHIREYGDLQELLDGYDEWSIKYETEQLEEGFEDLYNGRQYHIGQEVDLVVSGRTFHTRYLGEIPVVGLGMKGNRPAFISQGDNAIIYLTGNTKNEISFQVLWLP